MHFKTVIVLIGSSLNNKNMETSSTFLTFRGNEYTLSFKSKEQLINDIEELAGIYAPNQLYYSDRRIHRISSLMNQEPKYFQVATKGLNYSRLFINTPQCKVKVYILDLENKKVEDLCRCFFNAYIVQSLNYPYQEYAFKYNNQIIQIGQSLAGIPNDSEIDLVNEAVYQQIDLLLTIQFQNSMEIQVFIDPAENVLSLKNKITEFEDIPAYRQRLIYEGNPLEDNQPLSHYNIPNNSTIKMIIGLLQGSIPITHVLDPARKPASFAAYQVKSDSRRVISGLSFYGKCNNTDCREVNNEVLSNHGFGIFNVLTEKNTACCQLCENKLGVVDGLGLFCCKFRFWGVNSDGEEKEGSGQVGDEDYFELLNGNFDNWRTLMVQIDSGKE